MDVEKCVPALPRTLFLLEQSPSAAGLLRPELWPGLFVFEATRLSERRTFPTFAVLNLHCQIL